MKCNFSFSISNTPSYIKYHSILLGNAIITSKIINTLLLIRFTFVAYQFNTNYFPHF
ncbi:hypothetical protein KQI07_13695 [Lactiplantibacillus argentoratensis]|nr:hypothetical protein [Lactiplantibacillus argentoratensis]